MEVEESLDSDQFLLAQMAAYDEDPVKYGIEARALFPRKQEFVGPGGAGGKLLIPDEWSKVLKLALLGLTRIKAAEKMFVDFEKASIEMLKQHQAYDQTVRLLVQLPVPGFCVASAQLRDSLSGVDVVMNGMVDKVDLIFGDGIVSPGLCQSLGKDFQIWKDQLYQNPPTKKMWVQHKMKLAGFMQLRLQMHNQCKTCSEQRDVYMNLETSSSNVIKAAALCAKKANIYVGGYMFAIDTAVEVLKLSCSNMAKVYTQYAQVCVRLEQIFHDAMQALQTFPVACMRQEEVCEVIEV